MTDVSDYQLVLQSHQTPSTPRRRQSRSFEAMRNARGSVSTEPWELQFAGAGKIQTDLIVDRCATRHDPGAKAATQRNGRRASRGCGLSGSTRMSRGSLRCGEEITIAEPSNDMIPGRTHHTPGHHGKPYKSRPNSPTMERIAIARRTIWIRSVPVACLIRALLAMYSGKNM